MIPGQPMITYKMKSSFGDVGASSRVTNRGSKRFKADPNISSDPTGTTNYGATPHAKVHSNPSIAT